MTDILWAPDAPAPPVEPKPFISPVPTDGANKYHGPIAAGYDAKRERAPKWIAEQRIIEGWLRELPEGSTVLDIPVGTGRFLHVYDEKHFRGYAADISEDMIRQALQKRASGSKIQFALADVRRLDGLKDKTVDCSTMCRLTRWLSPDDCRVAIHELARVTRQRIIFTTRIRHPRVPAVARPMELFAVEGWKIARDEAADGPDYRVVMMEPA